MNENTLITLESGSEDDSLNLLKDFNVKVWHTLSCLCGLSSDLCKMLIQNV